MNVLYTDNDAKCCQWLENLVAAGQLPNQPELFAGTSETGKRGVLNPNHSRWLMGFPKRLDLLRGYGNGIVPQLSGGIHPSGKGSNRNDAMSNPALPLSLLALAAMLWVAWRYFRSLIAKRSLADSEPGSELCRKPISTVIMPPRGAEGNEAVSLAEGKAQALPVTGMKGAIAHAPVVSNDEPRPSAGRVNSPSAIRDAVMRERAEARNPFAKELTPALRDKILAGIKRRLREDLARDSEHAGRSPESLSGEKAVNHKSSSPDCNNADQLAVTHALLISGNGNCRKLECAPGAIRTSSRRFGAFAETSMSQNT